MGGRIVYASRIPPRPHEALRLGGFEDGRGRCLEKFLFLVRLDRDGRKKPETFFSDFDGLCHMTLDIKENH